MTDDTDRLVVETLTARLDRVTAERDQLRAEAERYRSVAMTDDPAVSLARWFWENSHNWRVGYDDVVKHIRDAYAPKMAERDRLLGEMKVLRDYDAERDRLVSVLGAALMPFAKAGRSVPGNWPDCCSLHWEGRRSDGSRYLGYYHAGDMGGPTVGDYLDAAELLFGSDEMRQAKSGGR